MNQCATCHAGCCRTYVVPLTGADILKIMSRRDLSFWDVACRWADPTGAIALKYAPHFYFRDAPETPFVISLLQESSRQFPGTLRCKFLVEGQATPEQPLGASYCGIYNERPSACRVYPTKFDRTGEMAVLCEIPAPKSGSSHPAHRLCAKPWEPHDFDPVEQVQALAVAKFEMNFFFRLAEAWNARPRDWQAFPEFLRLVYSNRIRSEADYHEGECDEIQDEIEPRPIVRFPRLAA